MGGIIKNLNYFKSVNLIGYAIILAIEIFIFKNQKFEGEVI